MCDSAASSADELLATGDCYLLDGCYEEAVNAYAACLVTVSETDQLIKFRALSHKSAALLHLKRNEEALEDAQSANQLYDSFKFSGLRRGEIEACRRREWKAARACGDRNTAKAALIAARELALLNNSSTTQYDTSLAKMKAGEEDRNRNDQIHGALASSLNASSSSAKPATPSQLAPKTEGTTDDRKEATKSKPKPQAAPDLKRKTPRSLTSNAFGSAPLPTKANGKIDDETPKYQYYQNDNVMTIAILEPNVKEEDLYVDIDEEDIKVTMRKGGAVFTLIDGSLFDSVVVSRCKLTLKDEKVLVKLRKDRTHEWHDLLSRKKKEQKKTAVLPVSEGIPAADKTKPTPYASHRDWDAIEKHIEMEDKAIKPEGEDAMNSLFQTIYADADEDTKRAMMKSYQTSGGTVLSTNWNEVSNKDYEQDRVAPKGMEWKTWEGEKLATEDDD